MKLLLWLVAGWVLTVGYAVITTPFVLVGWNCGLAQAVSFAHPLTWFQAFCVALLTSTIGTMFKPMMSADVKEVDADALQAVIASGQRKVAEERHEQ